MYFICGRYDKLYYSNKDHVQLFKTVETDLMRLIQWFKTNKLSLNVSKTNVVLFSNNDIPPCNDLKLVVGNESIKLTNSVKFLGMYLDSKLSWCAQTNHIKNKLSSALYMLNSTKNIISSNHLKTLYYTLLHPYLTYGIMLWGSTLQQYLRPIEKKQNKAMRIITNSNFNCHASQLYKLLSIPKLCDVFNIELSKFMYSHYNNKLPPPLMSFFTSNRTIHSHFTRHSNDHHIISRTTQIMSKSFICQGPDIWLHLPSGIKLLSNLNTFKNNIKRHFLCQY